jgi:hypothetical protein
MFMIMMMMQITMDGDEDDGGVEDDDDNGCSSFDVLQLTILSFYSICRHFIGKSIIINNNSNNKIIIIIINIHHHPYRYLERMNIIVVSMRAII